MFSNLTLYLQDCKDLSTKYAERVIHISKGKQNTAHNLYLHISQEWYCMPKWSADATLFRVLNDHTDKNEYW